MSSSTDFLDAKMITTDRMNMYIGMLASVLSVPMIAKQSIDIPKHRGSVPGMLTGVDSRRVGAVSVLFDRAVYQLSKNQSFWPQDSGYSESHRHLN